MNRGNYKILVVDDEQGFALLISRILGDEGYQVRTMSHPREALAEVDSYHPDLVITDLKMPGMNGVEFMTAVRAQHQETDFIMVTAFASVETAVAAMKLGALDYITKPLKEPEELRRVVLRAFERQRLSAENRALREEVAGDMPPLELVFSGMPAVLEEVSAVAPADTTVILYGETGTGKGLVAGVIHRLSGRRGLMVTINCAAIPENLLESELFGHERGSFTGAVRTKKGKFELADEGTVFLDEIGEMSPSLQAKLLRVLQERRFERVGGLDVIHTSARIIAATNRDLKQLVSQNRFREDLYYRLNVFPVHIPPLRQRRDIIPQLTRYLVERLSRKIGKPISDIPGNTLARLMSHQWPGNVRELENVIEKAVILSRDATLTVPRLHDTAEGGSAGDMRSIEKKAIEEALKKTGGKRKEAADILGISLRSLQYKIKGYGIEA